MTQDLKSTSSTELLSDSSTPFATSPGQMNVEWFRNMLGSGGLLDESDLCAVELDPVGGGVSPGWSAPR
jgi:hypothetical protein